MEGGMALIHKMSDLLDCKIEKDANSHPVIELQFKFIRVLWVVDDMAKALKVKGAFDIIMGPAFGKQTEKQKLPSFYKKELE